MLIRIAVLVFRWEGQAYGHWDLKEEESKAKKERERGGKTRRMSLDVLGSGGREVGVPVGFRGSVLAMNSHTQPQEEAKVYVWEGMRKKKRKDRVYT